MPLKEYAGNAPATRLSAQLLSGTTSNFTVITSGGTGYPTGGTAPFVVCIDRGTALEEKILCSERSGDTFTIAASGRGYDNTTAATHAAQATVEHTLDALSLTELMAHKYTDADPHAVYLTQTEGDARYLQSSSFAAALIAGFPAFEIDRSFTLAGDIFVPSGDTDYVPGIFVPEIAGWRSRITRMRHRINGGTSATVKLQNNGVDITGFTGISVTTTSATTNPGDVDIVDLDYLTLVVTAVSGNPKNLSASVMLEYDMV